MDCPSYLVRLGAFCLQLCTYDLLLPVCDEVELPEHRPLLSAQQLLDGNVP